jgi:hypothetical protein
VDAKALFDAAPEADAKALFDSAPEAEAEPTDPVGEAVVAAGKGALKSLTFGHRTDAALASLLSPSDDPVSYSQARKEMLADDARASQAHPIASAVGGMAPSLLVPGAAFSTLPRALATGAAMGAVQGVDGRAVRRPGRAGEAGGRALCWGPPSEHAGAGSAGRGRERSRSRWRTRRARRPGECCPEVGHRFRQEGAFGGGGGCGAGAWDRSARDDARDSGAAANAREAKGDQYGRHRGLPLEERDHRRPSGIGQQTRSSPRAWRPGAEHEPAGPGVYEGSVETAPARSIPTPRRATLGLAAE